MSYRQGIIEGAGLIVGENVFVDEDGLVKVGTKSQHELEKRFRDGQKAALSYQILTAKLAPIIDTIFENQFKRDTEITIEGKPIMTFHADGSVTDHRPPQTRFE